MIYLDYASTTPLDKTLLERYRIHQIHHFVNSDSTYPAATKLKFELENARKGIAHFLGVDAKDLIFTASGSEANSLAIKGLAFAHRHKGKHLITSTIEHPSILEAFKQLSDLFEFEVDYVSVDQNGKIDLNHLQQLLRNDTILVSIMQVNNEVGSIQPLKEASTLIRAHSKALIHSDMIQALGKEELALQYVDSASFSGHKVYGFKGLGMLYKRHHLELVPLINGGSQEFGYRGGTSDASRFIAWKDIVQQAIQNQEKHREYVQDLNHYLRDHIQSLEYYHINSPLSATPYILSISHMKLGSEIVKNHLLNDQIMVSSRSTCSSKSNQPSHVLQAMNASKHALQGVIRISLSHLTTKQELDTLINALKEVNQYVR